MAVREILKYPGVKKVTLVDLDSQVTHLFKTHPDLIKLNSRALLNPKVTIVNADAFQWLRNEEELFDFIVVDFPDPSNFSIAKLFSTTFYRELKRKISPSGAAVIQATSPFVARKSYWCIAHTLKSVGFEILPYHAYIPSFGEWGFVLVSHQSLTLSQSYLSDLKFVSTENLPSMLTFPKDMSSLETGINRLNHPILVQYFDEEWSQNAP